MIIKKIKSNDIEKIMELIGDTIKSLLDNGINQWDNLYPNRDTIIFDITNDHAYGYFIDDQLAGYMALNTEFDIQYNTVNWKWNNGPVLYLHRLMVNPKYQRRGIAKELMMFYEEYAKKNGYYSLRFDTFSGNPFSTQLYDKLGYFKAGSVYFRTGEFVVYEKKI